MSRDEYKTYNDLRALLRFAYGIADRDLRVRAVGKIQQRMAEMMGEN